MTGKSAMSYDQLSIKDKVRAMARAKKLLMKGEKEQKKILQ